MVHYPTNTVCICTNMSRGKLMEIIEQENNHNFNNNITRNRILNYKSSTATVKLSIDFIRISIDSKHYNTTLFYNLFNKIESMSVLSSEYRFKYGVGYSQIKTYYISFNNQVHEVVTLRCPSDPDGHPKSPTNGHLKIPHPRV